MTFDGLYLVVVPPTEVSRSWRERLFSVPWRPLRKTKFIQPLKDGEVMRVGNALHMTAATRRELRDLFPHFPPTHEAPRDTGEGG